MEQRRNEAGQIIPIAGFLMGMVAVAMLVIAHVGSAALTQSQAQTAADAAALAAVGAGNDKNRAAEVTASANGASLVRLDALARSGGGVEVEVVLGDRRAQARAQLQGGLGQVE